MRIILVTTLLMLSVSLNALEYPQFWRTPTQQELSSELLRRESASGGAELHGDFNGDGAFDHVYLLKNIISSDEGLFVYLSSPKGYQWVQLDQFNFSDDMVEPMLVMGIEWADPASYTTACGQGYYDCPSDQSEEIAINAPAISYFQFDGASSVFYFDSARNKFIQIPVSN